VPSADTLVDALTVVEMLMYTAELELERLVQEHKSFEKAALDGLIDDMGLDAAGCQLIP